eukprot:CAMPEP_0204277026 /NCGR_PEP_ID=MMETSP0468-20130131/29062_1 /ASSEMBLY_ACC=CAM_ASM_000383 /TAXON_ID=2969 /ORGANISM="Oxyrrhis marina" /LENGTH=175 /DNA_ID=CAMNT_0051253743 /DNA_START=37 /DNA_END=564 /DNA_ORIENTATION=-
MDLDDVTAAPAFDPTMAVENASEGSPTEMQPDPMFPSDSPQAADPFAGMNGQQPPAAMPSAAAMSEAQNKLREWEAEHENELEAKAREEDVARKTMREQAKQALNDWHKERNDARDQRVQTLKAEETSTKSSQDGNKEAPWERVDSMLQADTSTHERDVSRMKGLLTQLKHSGPE